LKEQTIYIHIGMPKTGTSSIQALLYENRDQLLELGYYYPDSQVFAPLKISSGNAVELYSLLSERRYLEVEEMFIKFLEKSKDCILSSESLFFLDDDISEALFNILDNFNYKFILYIRDFSEYMSSSYAQLIKTSDELREFSECYKQFSEPICKKIIFYIDKLKDKLIIRAYDSNIDVCKDFLSILNINSLTDNEKLDSKINISFSNELTEYLRLFNLQMKNITDLDNVVKIKGELFVILAEYSSIYQSRKRSLFCTKQESIEINDIFSPALELIYKEYGIKINTHKKHSYLETPQKAILNNDTIREINSFIFHRFFELDFELDNLVAEIFPMAKIFSLINKHELALMEKNNQLAEKDVQLTEKSYQLAEKELEIQAILKSNSWKITKPIRAIIRKLKSIFY